MERPASWKVLTLGAALTGLSVAGAGAAEAGSASPGTTPASVGLGGDLNASMMDSAWGSWGSPWVPGENLDEWIPWEPGQVIDNWVPWVPTPFR